MSSKKTRRPQAAAPDSLKRGETAPLDKRIRDLVELMHARIADRKPLNFTEPTHREITEALHILAYERGPGGGAGEGEQLRVTYGDNSKPDVLRVRCLSPCPPVHIDEARTLNIGTLSFRHLDYDHYVDLYLIRDRETRTLTAGEIDKRAYDRMKEVLEDSALQRAGSQVMIYQAGLESLAVGLYRAIIEHLYDRRRKGLPTLALQTMYYIDEQNRRGQGPIWA